MDLQATLERGRAMAEEYMVDTCRVTKPGEGARVLNQETGKYDDPEPAVVYQGRCRLSALGQAGAVTEAAAGDAAWDVQASVLHLPVTGTETVRPGHTVTYLTAAHDSALVGNVYGVVGPHETSTAASRRLLVKRVVH